mgnify:CR=1 FL=1
MDKLVSAISLCRKAGKLKMGTEAVKEQISEGNAKLVLTASDLADRSKRQIRFVCDQYKLPVAAIPYTMENLSVVTGKKYGILAICDEGFAEMIGGLVPPAG